MASDHRTYCRNYLCDVSSRRTSAAVIATLALALCILSTAMDVSARELLYPEKATESVGKIPGRLLDPAAPKIPYESLTFDDGWFVRITRKANILSRDGRLKTGAHLHRKKGRVLVFATTPSSIQGKSLKEILLDIGYTVKQVRGLRGEEQVAVAFRLPVRNRLSKAQDGQLSTEWRDLVHVPTWTNIFALFGEMALDSSALPKASERRFVLAFPQAGKDRIASTDYARLEAGGGGDWRYRELLQKHLSLNKHFKGDGRTHNVERYPSGFVVDTGVLEYLVPNQPLASLPELFVIGLGAHVD